MQRERSVAVYARWAALGQKLVPTTVRLDQSQPHCLRITAFAGITLDLYQSTRPLVEAKLEDGSRCPVTGDFQTRDLHIVFDRGTMVRSRHCHEGGNHNASAT